MSNGTPALVVLARAGVGHTVHPYDHDPAIRSFGDEAAKALGVSTDRIFKTLLVDVDGRLVVAVVPVSGALDLKALADATGGKRATMADVAVAERTTGYVVGGISPLGQRIASRAYCYQTSTPVYNRATGNLSTRTHFSG